MDVVFANLLLDLSHAALIWLGLAAAAAVATVALIAYHRTDADGERTGAPTLAVPLRRIGELLREAVTGPAAEQLQPAVAGPSTGQLLAAHTRTLQQRAKEAAQAAERAASLARRRREEWLTAQDAADRAWQEFDAADTDARRVLAANAIPLPRTPQTPAEYAFRERFLHRGAMSACSHNRLSALELSDALAHRGGWDPRRHPIEQETVLSRAARETLREEYGRAAAREKTAWLASEAAAAAAASLRRAADAAGTRARWAQRRTVPGAVAATPDQTMVLPVIQAADSASR
ncbi:hypothetical protein QEZ54_22955 [Catellatospora sp. KI3]|uniref:hypothetical protein n=1 Tax=Catellatospora sp. KI3 TaxID=3041620 RepID=UPI002482C48B|nr:hypothetical protein [Catellatospora sp. KI3]MDI1463849.1 hypothetical protein [Catellatospora sp. KI3]